MPSISLTDDQAEALSLQAGTAFTPRGPVKTRELFAGRRDQIRTLIDTVAQRGLHAVVYGERGVGKTSLANIIPPLVDIVDEKRIKAGEPSRIVLRLNANTTDSFSSIWARAFDEIMWVENRPRLGFAPGMDKEVVTLRQAFRLEGEVTIDVVRRVLSALDPAVFIIDEFDRLPRKAASHFTDLVKALSDNNVPCTIVIVGVADTVEDLIRDHASINRAIIQIPMPRMSRSELRDILKKGGEALGVQFQDEASDRIVHMSQGLPHYTHLVALHAVRAAARDRRSTIIREDVVEAFKQAVRQADQTLSSAWNAATRSAHSDALYEHVLLACAITVAANADSQGYFQPASVATPLSAVLKRKQDVEIATFNRHLGEFIEERRGKVLERTGYKRAYRYRFRNPLLPPYILMRGITDGRITAAEVESITSPGSLQ